MIEGRQRWHELLLGWGVDPTQADQKFDEIQTAYSGPGRFYHTLDHVLAVLDTVESLASYAKNLNAVKLAAWLHDVIYDSKASDNEERSAEFTERLCQELSIPEGQRIAALIRKTKTHDAGDDVDAQVLLDADLAILGASQSEYQAYAGKIRREYAWVPEPDYRKGRWQVLEKFLARPKIFHLLGHLEQSARRNLAREIAAELEWFKPWEPLKDVGEALVKELHKELSPQHVLYGVSVIAIARRIDCDDVLFAIADPQKPLAVVHLTWSGNSEDDPRWPSTAIFQCWREFVERCLVPDSREYADGKEID